MFGTLGEKPIVMQQPHDKDERGFDIRDLTQLEKNLILNKGGSMIWVSMKRLQEIIGILINEYLSQEIEVYDEEGLSSFFKPKAKSLTGVAQPVNKEAWPTCRICGYKKNK